MAFRQQNSRYFITAFKLKLQPVSKLNEQICYHITITHSLGLGHETMFCTVCLSIFLFLWKENQWWVLLIAKLFQVKKLPCYFGTSNLCVWAAMSTRSNRCFVFFIFDFHLAKIGKFPGWHLCINKKVIKVTGLTTDQYQFSGVSAWLWKERCTHKSYPTSFGMI